MEIDLKQSHAKIYLYVNRQYLYFLHPQGQNHALPLEPNPGIANAKEHAIFVFRT